MRTQSRLKWLRIVLLAAGCAGTMMACGGDDGGDGDEEASLAAPQSVMPLNARLFTLHDDQTSYAVDFEWTGVPGGASYILELDGAQIPVMGTRAVRNCTAGSHEWRVWARTEDGASGPPSQFISFTVLRAGVGVVGPNWEEWN